MYTKEQVIQIICAEFKLTPAELRTKSRERYLADIRRIIWHNLRIHTRLSWANIARLANRDHSTILNGVRRYEELYSVDNIFNAMAKRAEQALKNVNSVLLDVIEIGKYYSNVPQL